MVQKPKALIDYEKAAKKAKDRILNQKCNSCNKSIGEGGHSGTPNVCAQCLRGGE